MSTEYYYYANIPCPHCKVKPPPRRIGKSSAGWTFALATYPEKDIRDLPDWRRLFKVRGSTIENEYDEVIAVKDMLAIITGRHNLRKTIPPTAEFLRMNHATLGPNGLLRRNTDEYCVGWGKGTWDLVLGENL